MRFSLKNFRKDIITMWGFSYVLIIAIMLVIVTLNSIIYTKTTKKISADFNEYIFQTVSEDINGTLLAMNDVYLNITTNQNIPKSSDIKSLRFQPATHEFINDLASYTTFSEKVDGIFVYMKDSDTVISSSGMFPAKLFYDINLDTDKISFEDWKNQIKGIDDSITYLSMPYKNKSRHNIDALSLLFTVPNTQDNCVGVVLSDKNHLVQGFDNINWKNMCDIYIYNRSGKLVAYKKTSEKGVVPQELKQLSLYKNQSNVIHFSEITVNGHSWQFVTVAPNNTLDHNLKYIQLLIVLIILISLVIIFYVVRSIIKKNYRPIKTMLSYFNITETTNEYENLFSSISSALSQNLYLSKEIDTHNKNLKKINLGKLLCGDIYYSQENNFGFEFSEDFFAVVIFNLENISDLFNEDTTMSNHERLFYLSFITDNITSELMGEKNIRVYTTEISSQVVCLLNFPESVKIENVTALADSARDFINRSFNITLTYALSGICEGSINIPVIYNQAIEVLDHKRILGIEEPMQYVENYDSQDKSKYIFDLNKEQALINAIKTGNSQSALTILDPIFEELGEIKNVPFDYIIYVALDVATTITKSANEIISTGINYDDTLLFYRKIKSGENLAALYSQMSEYIVKLCDEIKNDLLEGKNRVYFLISNIKKYIADNYNDPNLNISSIGTHFNINIKYISTIFKKDVGISLLDYINNLRIEKALQLIKQGQHSKREIAQLVGFTTERTFYRVLKKFEEDANEKSDE
ncbi:MAG: helix-turn-helix transcriptional regulator [Clostridia bacterium]|nr:helix-turn-helix transcriptional regulator [Clostridia bacterium]